MIEDGVTGLLVPPHDAAGPGRRDRPAADRPPARRHARPGRPRPRPRPVLHRADGQRGRGDLRRGRPGRAARSRRSAAGGRPPDPFDVPVRGRHRGPLASAGDACLDCGCSWPSRCPSWPRSSRTCDGRPDLPAPRRRRDPRERRPSRPSTRGRSPRAGPPWIDQQWGAQVILAAVYRLAGWTGLVLLRARLVGDHLRLPLRDRPPARADRARPRRC